MVGTLIALVSRSAGAGPWNIEPSIGVSSEYSTNPLLRASDATAETHVAGLVDFPLRYDGDADEFTLHPYGRISNSQGYDSLASNYVHLDSAAQFNDELGTTTVTASLARDSSLRYLGPLVNGAGVRRDTESAGADWTHAITERAQIDLNASWSDVKFAQPEIFDDIQVDYRYISAGPTLSYSWDERDVIKLVANAGLYQSLNGLTESKSQNFQPGLVRQLNGSWSLSVSAGYSKSANYNKEYFGPFYLGTMSRDQSGSVFSATLARVGEQVNLSASISRALQPTGFAFLSRQDSANFHVAYVRSERWDYAIDGGWQRAVNPAINGIGVAVLSGAVTAAYVSGQVAANWHWTPQWIVSMRANRVIDRYSVTNSVTAASTALTLSITRQFLQTEL
jgi:hypothetical protein